MKRLRWAAVLVLPLMALAAACTSYDPPKRDVSALSKLETGTRQDCNTILGTAFHSQEEREWFEQNCSKWPAVALAQVPAAAPPPPGQPAPGQPAPAGGTTIQGETPECAAMRGRPYSSEQQRTWFLQNCIRPEVPAAPVPNPPAAAVRPGVVQPTPVVNANAAVCDTLRRSPYVTDEQRRWYFTYCNIR
jgi:hypothetical protein